MKKLLAVLLAVMVCLTSLAPAFAARSSISSAAPGVLYSKGNWDAGAYKLAQTYTGTATVEYDFVEMSSSNEYIMGLADKNGPNGDYMQLPVIMRVNPEKDLGCSLDIRNGDKWITLNDSTKSDGDPDPSYRMTANTKYHFKITVDIAAKTWSAWMTPPGGAPIQIAENYKYRNTATTPISALGKLILFASDPDGNGIDNQSYVQNLTVKGTDALVIPSDVTYSKGNWDAGAYKFEKSHTAKTTVEYDFTETSNANEYIMGLADQNGPNGDYMQLPVIMRVNPDKDLGCSLDIRNGDSWVNLKDSTKPEGDPDPSYRMTSWTKYHFKVTVDIPGKTWSAWMTPEGGKEIQIAADYKYRNTATTPISTLGKFVLFATGSDDEGIDNTSFIQNVTVNGAAETLIPNDVTYSKGSWDEGAYKFAKSYTAKTTVEYDFTETSSSNEYIMGLADKNGPNGDYMQLPVIMRVNPDKDLGCSLDIRNGDSWVNLKDSEKPEGDPDPSYRMVSGAKYHFKVTIDIPGKTWSAWMTPEGGKEIQIAADYKYRNTATTPISTFGKLVLFATGSDDEGIDNTSYIQNVKVNGAAEALIPNDVTYSRGSWDAGTYNFAGSYKSKTTVEYDFTETSSSNEYIMGLADKNGPNGDYMQLPVIMRVNPDKDLGCSLDIRNGDSWVNLKDSTKPEGDPDPSYRMVSGAKYHFKVTIDIPAKTWSAWMTPEGGKEIQIAADYKYRNSATTPISTLGKFVLFATGPDDAGIDNASFVQNVKVNGTPVKLLGLPKALPTPSPAPTPTPETTTAPAPTPTPSPSPSLPPVAAGIKNIARFATATVSSQQKDAPLSKAESIIDGVVDGFTWAVYNTKDAVAIKEAQQAEWASNHDDWVAGIKPWAQLTWDKPVKISEVRLYDRVDSIDDGTGYISGDHILTGTLTFGDSSGKDDGNPIAVSNLPVGGTKTPGIYKLPADRTVTWVKFTIETCTDVTWAPGLAEFEVYGDGSDFGEIVVPSPTPRDPMILEVGPNKRFTTPAEAMKKAMDGDTILIDATGSYFGDSASLFLAGKKNITIKGVNGRPKMQADPKGTITNGQGIWVVSGTNITIENIEFADATCANMNGAGIRVNDANEGAGGTLTLKNCYFYNNQTNLLTAASDIDLTIENCEFSNGGFGPEDEGSHNIYVGHVKSFTMRYSYSHNVKNGMLVKTRATTNYIEYNRLTDDSSDGNKFYSNYNIDIPNAGTSYIIGNILWQNAAENSNWGMIAYGMEGSPNEGRNCYVINNTLVSEAGSTAFIKTNINDGTLGLNVIYKNNIFAGTGSVEYGKGTYAGSNNYTYNKGSDPGIFADKAKFDYSLTAAATDCIDKGVDPGTSTEGYALAPTKMYAKNYGFADRPVSGSALDIGVSEFVTYSDIEDSWAKSDIEFLATKNFISGATNTSFEPTKAITRGDFIKWLINTLGFKANIIFTFDDVKTTDSYYVEVNMAKALGITNGVGDNMFKPTASIERQDAMVLIARALDIAQKIYILDSTAPLSAFTDKGLIASYAQSSVATLVKEGIFVGSNKKINPKGTFTRQETATVMARLYKKY